MFRTPAIVLGLNPNALGTIRSLHRAGIPVIAVDRAPRSWRDINTWMSSRTRLCRKVFLPHDADSGQLCTTLLRLSKEVGGRPPIIPSGDGDTVFLLENEAALAGHLAFRLPSPETANTLMDKRRFLAQAEQLGIPVPRTLFDVHPETIAGIAADIRYPCFLKPLLRDAGWDARFPVDKGFAASSPAQLIQVFEQASGAGTKLLLQEIIPGNDSEIYFSHVYIGGAGEVQALWTGRKFRQLPIHFGSATAGETAAAPEVAEYSLRLLRALDYRGYASIEFRRDPRDGRHVILDVAVGRTCYHHYLGLAAGINIPAIWYRDLVGLPPEPPQLAFRKGVRWVDEYRDLIACADYRRNGEFSFTEWVGTLRRLRAPIYWSWRDPLPFLFVLARLGMSVVNAFRRRIPGQPAPGG